MTTAQERSKKIRAALYTVAVNLVVLLVLMFAAAWKTGGSGQGDYPGIEVNLGYDEQGSGDIEPRTPIGSPDARDDEDPPAKLEEQPQQEIPEAKPVEQPEVAKVNPSETLTDPNSDVEINEEKKESKPVEKPVTKKTEKTEKPAETKTEEKPRVVDSKAVYKGKTSESGATSGNGEGKQGTAGNEGDDTGKAGNKGVEGGTEGAAVYKGRPGGGGGVGVGLDMNGWDWASKPNEPPINDNFSGYVILEITVDDQGEVERIDVVDSNLSTDAVNKCKAELQKVSLQRKVAGPVPPRSKGRVTFRYQLK